MTRPRRPITRYRNSFFRDQAEISARSATVIVPAIIELCSPNSVADVGCGVGTWLAEFRRRGLQDVAGYDGALPAEDMLRVPRELIQQVDLTRPLDLERVFDLVLCLEVGEHLPEASADTLVASLVRAAPVVVFSAAVPHQGGTGHINEQWQSWWAQKFAARGFEPSLALRRQVWRRSEAASYYAQNTVVYYDPARSGDRAMTLQRVSASLDELDVIHPRMWERRAGQPITALLGRVLPEPLKRIALARLRDRVDYLRRV